MREMTFEHAVHAAATGSKDATLQGLRRRTGFPFRYGSLGRHHRG